MFKPLKKYFSYWLVMKFLWISALHHLNLKHKLVTICFFIVFRILLLSTEDLQQHFETEASESIKHPSRYARNFLEYCCFKALAVATQLTDHLSDKNFRRLTFDMMLAWEAPAAASKPLLKVRPVSDFPL
jgi:hypothetical protein